MLQSILTFSGILLLGGFVQGLTGFGLALTSVSLLSLLLDPKVSVPLAGIFGWIVTIPIVIRMWFNVRLKEGLLLILCSLPGSYLGAVALKNLHPEYILLAMGIILALSSTYSVFYKPMTFEIKKPAANLGINGAIGFLSGTLGAAVGEPGPPVILWLSSRSWEPGEIKATLSLFFMLQMVGAIIGFAINGLLTAETLRLGLYALPGFIAGTVLGILSFDFFHKKQLNYHRIVHILLAIIGIRLIWRSIAELTSW